MKYGINTENSSYSTTYTKENHLDETSQLFYILGEWKITVLFLIMTDHLLRGWEGIEVHNYTKSTIHHRQLAVNRVSKKNPHHNCYCIITKIPHFHEESNIRQHKMDYLPILHNFLPF